MAIITVTNTFISGTTIIAGDMNQNFTDIINGTSDGTKSFNIDAFTASGTITFDGLTASRALWTNAGSVLATNGIDSAKLIMGTGLDTEFFHDGSNLILNPLATGTTAAFVINENSASVDLRVEGATATQLLVVDASADTVEIGTGSQGAIATFGASAIALKQDTEVGSGPETPTAQFAVSSSSTTGMQIIGSDAGVLYLSFESPSASGGKGLQIVSEYDNDVGIIRTQKTGMILGLNSGNNTRALTLDSNQNVDIPSGTLTVSGGITANGGVTLGAGDDLIGSSTSDITMNTNKFTVAGATGNTTVAGTLVVTGGITANGGVTLGAGDDLIGSSTSDINMNSKFTVAGATGATTVAGALSLNKGSQNYMLTDNGSGMALESQSSGTAAFWELFTTDGDGTDNIFNIIYGVGTVGSVTNRERLISAWIGGGTSEYRIYTESNGTGSDRDLVLFTASNTNQIKLDTTGFVQIGAGDLKIAVDNNKLLLGTADDASITYDGTNMVINPKEVGSGRVFVSGSLSAETATAGAVTANAIADDIVAENSGDGGMTILTPDANLGSFAIGSPSDEYAAAFRWKFSTLECRLGTFATNGTINIVSGNNASAMTIDASQDIDAKGNLNAVTLSTGGNETFTYDEGSFTGTLTGCTTSPTATINYIITGNRVTVLLPNLVAESNTTALTITGAPAAIRPTTGQDQPALVNDDGNTFVGAMDVGTGGTFTFSIDSPLASSGFTNTGTKGVRPGAVTYSLF